ncbi:MAG TPA: bifunctional riboflavin kinase/FAD synthetase [Steroidobacteraceae bacterium]|nr:bifunctional riboflavin kinase/FAD synthetase [Steroidobacteraceae bacterium]
MHLFRGLTNCRTDGRGVAVAIGNFDGVHLGHQALVRAARERALASGARLAALTFEPHPREYFDAAAAPPRLMRLGEKCAALAALGVESLIVLRFDARLQHQTAEDFVAQTLCRGLGARHVVVGEGFRFGCRRAGTIETLAAAGARAGFEVVAVPSVTADGVRVSSTRVREALGAGNLAAAARLLGRPYAMTGRVIYGQQLGRRLGYPTANLRLHRRATPLGGVFAVEVGGLDGRPAAAAVASLGNRPTIGGGETLLEVHLFDFDGDLYGRRLSVDFVAKLRDEEKFPSLDALVVQMHADATRAREILAARAA